MMRRFPGLALALLLLAGPALAFDNVGPTQAGVSQNAFASASSSNATVTITGVTNKRARLYGFAAVCNAGTASLTVSNGATQIWYDVVGTTAVRFAWPVPLMGTAGSTMTITLSSCTSGVGSLSVQGDLY